MKFPTATGFAAIEYGDERFHQSIDRTEAVRKEEDYAAKQLSKVSALFGAGNARGSLNGKRH